MMYVLTQEEFDARVPREQLAARTEALAAVRLLLLKQANYTCIHDRGPDPWSMNYCDDCPIAKLDHDHHRYACTRRKEWSK